jgi:hypothetical protein
MVGRAPTAESALTERAGETGSEQAMKMPLRRAA